MFRKRKQNPLVEMNNADRWNNAIDQVESHQRKKNRGLTETQYTALCLQMAHCLTLSVKDVVADKVSMNHVNFFINFMLRKKLQELTQQARLALFESMFDLYIALLLKRDKNVAETKLQQLMVEGLEVLKTVVPRQRLKAIGEDVGVASAPIVAMRREILQQPFNMIVDEFFRVFKPEMDLKDLPRRRNNVFKHMTSETIANETANLSLEYSNSLVAECLAKIPNQLNDPLSFKMGTKNLNRVKESFNKLTPLELAQFHFLSGRANLMSGSAQVAIHHFQKALNVAGLHIGHHFTITANLFCAIQQYAMEVSHKQETLLVRKSIQLRRSDPKKEETLTHHLRRDPLISLLSDIPTATAFTLFQPKYGLKRTQIPKKLTDEERLEILKVNVTHYVNAAIFVCSMNVAEINVFVNSILNSTAFENARRINPG